MENNNKRVPVMTIIAAVFSGVNILFYLLFIVVVVTGFINSFPDIVLLVLVFCLPAVSVVAFVFSLTCRRDRIKPFWIPNLIISIILLLSAFPASCASLIYGIRNDVQRNNADREQRLRAEVQEQTTIEFIKKDMAIMKSHSKGTEAAYDYFISMEFTFMDSIPDHLQLASNPVYLINRGNGNEYKVTFFEDNTGIQIFSRMEDHQYIGGLIRVNDTKYYSCKEEAANRFYELLRGDGEQQQYSQSIEQSVSLI